MSFFTYILRCADGTYYTGFTDDLDKRVAEHHSGARPEYTTERRPVELKWSESFDTLAKAEAREREIKTWGRRKKEALIAGDRSQLMQVAAPSAKPSPHMEEDRAPAPPPIIVLVRPQLGANIGKAARAMLNFGLTELRLVAPRDGWPNPDAGPSSAGADIVLANAQVYETLAEAVADCAHVFATTVRKRGVTMPVVTPEEAAREIRAEPGRSAIVFGPERSGLETEDVALSRTIITVPVNPEFGSLNLAQAVILCAYEWSKSVTLAQPTLTDLLPPAPQVELEAMIVQLETMLEAAGYFFPAHRTVATKLTLRTMLTKPAWNHLEVRTLRGVLAALANPRQRD